MAGPRLSGASGEERKSAPAVRTDAIKPRPFDPSLDAPAADSQAPPVVVAAIEVTGKVVDDRRRAVAGAAVELLTTGTVARPRFSIDFPAEYIATEMEWKDLVLHPATMKQIREIQNWITHNGT